MNVRDCHSPFLGCLGKIMAFFAVVCLGGCVDDDVSRGNAALRIGDYDRAILSFNKALDQEPAHRDARYGLALSYYAVAESEEQLGTVTFELWSRTAREFEILSRVDSSGKIDANYSSCLFYLARATMLKNSKTDVLPLLDHSLHLLQHLQRESLLVKKKLRK